jgi:hypothetical protein
MMMQDVMTTRKRKTTNNYLIGYFSGSLHYCHRPFAYIIVPENLSQRGGSEIDTTASAGRKTREREKLSGRQESAGEIPSQRWEIVAIVIAIASDFIGIIITIILITSTFICTITTPSRCNILS